MSNTPNTTQATEDFLTCKVTLSRGLSIKGQFFKVLTIREQFVEDMEAVERDDQVPAYMTISFRKHLFARCLIGVEGFEGTVTPSMLNKLNRSDWAKLVNEFDQLEEEGKSE